MYQVKTFYLVPVNNEITTRVNIVAPLYFCLGNHSCCFLFCYRVSLLASSQVFLIDHVQQNAIVEQQSPFPRQSIDDVPQSVIASRHHQLPLQQNRKKRHHKTSDHHNHFLPQQHQQQHLSQLGFGRAIQLHPIPRPRLRKVFRTHDANI